MSQEFTTILTLSASIGFFHTILGPDHYLPFVAIAEVRRWSKKKTVFITALCGLGHVLGSVFLGIIGIALGIGVGKLKAFDAYRSNLAGWLLIGFGLVYLIWGIRSALKKRPHRHWHFHNKRFQFHKHDHHGKHDHGKEIESKADITPWVLFIIFILGPCESLIPLLMYPAAKGNFEELILVVIVFGVVTIGTMVTVTFLSTLGMRILPIRGLERYAHSIAGATIFLCGVAIQFLGL